MGYCAAILIGHIEGLAHASVRHLSICKNIGNNSHGH